MSFPLPLQPFFASNGPSESLFKAQAFLGAYECISAVVDEVDFQEQKDSLKVLLHSLESTPGPTDAPVGIQGPGSHWWGTYPEMVEANTQTEVCTQITCFPRALRAFRLRVQG